jgi:hypothetical protein
MNIKKQEKTLVSRIIRSDFIVGVVVCWTSRSKSSRCTGIYLYADTITMIALICVSEHQLGINTCSKDYGPSSRNIIHACVSYDDTMNSGHASDDYRIEQEVNYRLHLARIPEVHSREIPPIGKKTGLVFAQMTLLQCGRLHMQFAPALRCCTRT